MTLSEMIGKVIQGNALEVLKTLPEKSVNMVMTSPPYWALRSYKTEPKIWDAKEGCQHEWGNKIDRVGSQNRNNLGFQSGNERAINIAEINKADSGTICLKCNAWRGELGLEPHFNMYIKHLCDIFDQVKRVLRDDGTVWVNIADSFNSHSTGQGNVGGIEGRRENKSDNKANTNRQFTYPDKCLCLIPDRFAIEMVNRGWILRNTLIWWKRSCMPSSVKDRFTVDFEYVYFFAKQGKYYFQQQFEDISEAYANDKRPDGVVRQALYPNSKYVKDGLVPFNATHEYKAGRNLNGRNARCVWDICPQPSTEPHFAMYPEKLCERPILAGCPAEICNKCGRPRKTVYSSKGYHFPDKDNYDIQHINGVAISRYKSGRDYKKFREQNPIQESLTDCGCNAGFHPGTVLDPFGGMNTTGRVAKRLGRNSISIELNPKYAKRAKDKMNLLGDNLF